MNGNPDFTFKTFNPQKQDVTINLGVKIVASDGKVLLDRNDPVALKPGESREEHVKASGLVLGDKAARVYFDITDAATGAVYYKNDTSLWNAQSEDVKSYIKNLDVARKPVAPKLDFAYMPSFNRLDVSTDVGILGIDPKLPKAARYLSASFGKPGGELTGKNSTPFRADGTAELTFEFPQLPEGDYDINMEIQDADGKALVSKKDAFEQKVFPFQSYKGGLEETVVKPYTPIKTADHDFRNGRQPNQAHRCRLGVRHSQQAGSGSGRPGHSGGTHAIGRHPGRQGREPRRRAKRFCVDRFRIANEGHRLVPKAGWRG